MEKLRDLSPSEIDELRSMVAEKKLLIKETRKLELREASLSARRDIFWNKLRLEYDVEPGMLDIDDKLSVLSKAVPVESEVS
jgi:hypothetical protein